NEGKDQESESGQKGRDREEKEEDRSDEGGAEEEGRREIEAEEASDTQARPGAYRDSGTGAILDNARQRQRRGLVSGLPTSGIIGWRAASTRAIRTRCEMVSWDFAGLNKRCR